MKILVTGGAGAIGTHLVARLLDEGHEVVVVDDLSSGHRSLVPAGATMIEGSVVDSATLDQAFAGGPERVAHLAARFANQNSVDDPDADLTVNGFGTLRVLDRAARTGVARVLLVSSSCVYGHDSADESSSTRCNQTPYAITKALGEDYARFYLDHHGLESVIVRPFNSYGPHEWPGKYRNVVPNFLAAAMRGEPLMITGDGEETRDFTYVSDVVGAMTAALLQPVAPGSVFNIGTGREVRIGDLATKVNELVGNNAGVRHLGRRPWDRTTHRRASVERIRDALGFEAAVEIDEGLARTYAWLRTVGV